MMKKLLLLGIILLAVVLAYTPTKMAAATTLRFEISVVPGLVSKPQSGRLFVVMSRNSAGEPRQHISDTGREAPPVLARDLSDFAPGAVAVIDEKAIAFPIEDLAHLPAGDYSVQAVFDTNRDLASV